MPSVMGELPRELAERLWSDANLINAKSGRTILSLGARSTNVYIVLEGRVQVSLFSLGGREVILRDLGPGAIFGDIAAIDDRPRSASVMALSDCALASISGDIFRAAVTELPAGALWLARRLTAQVRDLTEKVFELNALQVRSRLHCELLRMSDDEGMLKPATTHAELASRVGTHREAVTREMRVLVEHGIVEQNRRIIRIVDLPALVQLVRIAAGDMDTDLLERKGLSGSGRADEWEP